MSSRLSNDSLHARAARGERAAFDELVRTRQQRVRAIALSVTRDVAASEEIAQAVFLRLWEALDVMRDPQAIDGWLRVATVNASKDWLRSRGRRERREARYAEVGQRSDETPLDSLTQQEKHDRIRALLDALSEEDRLAIILVYWEELSAAEVGEAMGVSEAAVRKRLQRARERLRSGSATLVALLVATRTAHAAAPPRPRRAGWFAVGGMVSAALVMLTWSAGSGEVSSDALEPIPAVAPVAVQTADAPIGGFADPDREETLWLYLDDVYMDSSRASISNGASIKNDFEGLLPPQLPTWMADDPLLSRFLMAAFGPSTDMSRALLQEVEAAGFALHGTWHDDPWQAFVAMEVARQRTDAARLDHIRAGMEAFDPETWMDMDTDAIHAQELHEAATPTYSLAIADEVLSRWPDHPVAPYAHHYALLAVADSHSIDRDRLRTELLALTTDDTPPALAHRAFETGDMGFSHVAYTIFSNADRDQFERWAQAHPDRPLPLDVAANVGRRLIHEGDVERASRWHALLEAGAGPFCETKSCWKLRLDIDDRASYIRMLQGQPALTWRDAMKRRVWECDKRHRVAVRTEGHGVWSGAWAWDALEPASSFTTCLRQPHEGPTPPDGLRLHIEAVPVGSQSRLKAAEERARQPADLVQYSIGMHEDGSIVEVDRSGGVETVTVLREATVSE